MKLHNVLSRDLPYIKDNRRNEISLGKLGLYIFKVDFVINIKEMKTSDWTKLNDESKSVIFDRVNRLLIIVHRRQDKINRDEVENFHCELKRLHRLVDYMKIKSSGGFLEIRTVPSIENLCVQIANILNSLHKYDDECDRRCITLLRVLQIEIRKWSREITQQEINLVHNALKTSGERYYNNIRAGHYYKCLCGFIYVVGDCGGPNQKGRCPDCKREIGGGNRIRAT